MDRVSPKVAQEVRVLFEHSHLDPGSREEVPGHHAGRAAARDAAGRARSVRHSVDPILLK